MTWLLKCQKSIQRLCVQDFFILGGKKKKSQKTDKTDDVGIQFTYDIQELDLRESSDVTGCSYGKLLLYEGWFWSQRHGVRPSCSLSLFPGFPCDPSFIHTLHCQPHWMANEATCFGMSVCNTRSKYKSFFRSGCSQVSVIVMIFILLKLLISPPTIRWFIPTGPGRLAACMQTRENLYFLWAGLTLEIRRVKLRILLGSTLFPIPNTWLGIIIQSEI